MPVTPAARGTDDGAGLPPLLQQAVAAHRDGRVDDAETLYREFIDQNSDHPTALQLFGLLCSQRGDYAAAIELMRKSLQVFPEQPEVANNLGNALKRSGRIDEAIEFYAQAIAIYPEYIEALRNKALCHSAKRQFDDAGSCLLRALEVKPDDEVSLLMLGNLQQQKGDHGRAIEYYEKALEVNPDYADAHHNLGLSLRMIGDAKQALERYRSARELGLDRAELYTNIGNALIDDMDADGAIEAYREAVTRNPLDLDAHKNLNSLLWQNNRHDQYLDSYRSAINTHPDVPQLRVAYAVALNQQGAHDKSEQVLRDGLARIEDSTPMRTLLALSLEGSKEWEQALEEHAKTVGVANAMPDHRINYARALLACQRPEEALKQAQLGAAQMPYNQRALAYLGLCWRLLGDERDAMLNDYENMVQVYDVPIPNEYSNAADFNQRLAAALDRLHIGKIHPPEQTLRGGSQTYGNLFERREREIQELVAGLQRCVEDYIARLPRHTEHPLLARKADQYDFSASWSVRLRSCGYHEMHVHPLGWISSAYYVQVPPELENSHDNEGGLKFGEPDIDLGEAGSARRFIKPETGRLVLFPSYMWHGTLPFESQSARTTVAFDVVPVGQPTASG